jgi:ATP-dependent helicase HrpB
MTDLTLAGLVAQVFPDRVAKQRGRDHTFAFYTLSNGRGVTLDVSDPLAKESYLVVLDCTGSATAARIIAAVPIAQAEIEGALGNQIATETTLTFDEATLRLKAREQRRLGRVLLSDAPRAVVASVATTQAVLAGVQSVGLKALPWTPKTTSLWQRMLFVRALEDQAWPDVREATLLETLPLWLEPHVGASTAVVEISEQALAQGLQGLLTWEQQRRLDTLAPTAFLTPKGTPVAIDYSVTESPSLSVRVQHLFGVREHPSVGEGRVPLSVELLSPAQRPIQITRDLPRFWEGSWAEVRAQMRGRYPKHAWPEKP